MEHAIIQVNSPYELKQQLLKMKNNHSLIKEYQTRTKNAILQNTWHARAQNMKDKFEEICK